MFAYELLGGLIDPSSKVLIVGPSMNYAQDPTPLFVAHLLKEGKGQLSIVDIQRKFRGKLSRRMGFQFLYGGLEDYRKSIQELVSKGVSLKEPEYVQANVVKTGFKNEAFDVILDHATTQLLTHNKLLPLEDILKEYLRVLKKGGKLIIMFKEMHPVEKDVGDKIRGYLIKNRLRIKFFDRSIVDKYIIEVPGRVQVEYGDCMQEGGKWKLVFAHLLYKCDSVIVIEK